MEYSGALHGGSPMLDVDFKKWQCPLSLYLQFPCHFLNSQISPLIPDLRKILCHVGNIFSHVDKLHIA